MDGRTIKLSATAIVAATTAIFGWVGTLVIIFILALAIDILTGFAVALKMGEWRSSIARSGLWKKAGSIIIVMCAGMFDLLIIIIAENLPALSLPEWYGALLLPVVTVWSILTEFGSIMENAGALGAPLPAILVSSIKVLNKRVELVGDDETLEP